MADQDRITLALAGDTMLGRGVGERIAHGVPIGSLVADEVAALMAGADLRILNLECCISDRGHRWPAAGKPFFFRAPPAAADLLRRLGVDAVTLANNHALDYGFDALRDTVAWLERAGIAWTGAGASVDAARAPAVVERRGVRVAIVGVADHPPDFAAATDRPGTAYADLEVGVPRWLADVVGAARSSADVVLVSPHWGPNMNPRPLPYVRRAAGELLAAGATLVAGHSAHVFQGVDPPVLFDLGDFLDDYAVDADLRNDLGLLWLVTVGSAGPERIEAVPLHLGFCATGLAQGPESAWVAERLARACASLGSAVRREPDGRLVVEVPQSAGAAPR